MPWWATKTAAEKAETNQQKQTQYWEWQWEKNVTAKLAAAEAETEMCREESVDTVSVLADDSAAVKNLDTISDVIELDTDTLAECLQETIIDKTDRDTVSLWSFSVFFWMVTQSWSEADADWFLRLIAVTAALSTEFTVSAALALSDSSATVKNSDMTLNVIVLDINTLSDCLQEITIDETEEDTVILILSLSLLQNVN